jgi:hypothetical protein
VRDCAAVGNDELSDGTSSIFVDTLLSGSWSTQTIPGVLDKQRVSGVSCSFTGNCLAVGTRNVGNIYPTGSTAFYATESSGVWSSPITIAPPSGTGWFVQGLSVSCAPGSACILVGWQETDPGTGDSFSLTYVPGSGIAGPATIIPAPAGSREIGLRSISCPTSTWCEAVGWDYSGSVAIVRSSGTWDSPSTLGKGSQWGGDPFAISCTSAGNCAASGPTYFNFHAQPAPYTVSDQVNGVWREPSDLMMPVQSPPARDSYTEEATGSVACTGAPMVCTFVTTVADFRSGSYGLTAQSGNDSWGEMQPVPVTPPIARRFTLAAVSCPSTLECVGVGDLATGRIDRTETFVPRAFTWRPARVAPGPVAALHVAVSGGINASITWQQPSSSAPGGYLVWAMRGSQPMNGPFFSRVPGYTLQRLTPHTTYQVVVQALGIDGQASTPSTSSSIRTSIGVPGVQTIRQVTPSARALTVEWNWPWYDGGAPIAHFLLRIVGPSLREVVVLPSNSSSDTVSGLVPDHSYEVWVAAENRAGRSPYSRPVVARTN